MKQHSKPCGECPWRKESAAGWLGASTPVEFLQQSESGIKMPCHLHINYEQDDWENEIDNVPECAGRSIHIANRCKSVSGILKLPADRDTVFSNPQDFIDHHSHGRGKKIMIIGNYVQELD
jgi:hypothetical protein